jgi:hypothetical protein
MTFKELIKPILGAGIPLSWRVGFSELSDEKRKPALNRCILYLIHLLPLVSGLSPLDKLFAIKPKSPI